MAAAISGERPTLAIGEKLNCRVDVFAEVAGSRDADAGTLFYQRKSFSYADERGDVRGGQGVAVFALVEAQAARLRLLVALNSGGSVDWHLEPQLLRHPSDGEQLVIPVATASFMTPVDRFVFRFKDGLPDLVEEPRNSSLENFLLR